MHVFKSILKFSQIFSKSSRPDVFCEKGVLRNFAKFTGKHLCQSLFFNKVLRNFAKFTGKHQCQSLLFNKVAGLQLYLKKTPAQVFSCEFCEISKNTFFTEHLWTTASVSNRKCAKIQLSQKHFWENFKVTD